MEGTLCCGIRVECIIEYYLDMNIPNPKDTYEFEEILIITNDWAVWTDCDVLLRRSKELDLNMFLFLTLITKLKHLFNSNTVHLRLLGQDYILTLMVRGGHNAWARAFSRRNKVQFLCTFSLDSESNFFITSEIWKKW